MDWANQPIPFRFYEGSPKIRLPLIEQDAATAYAGLYGTGAAVKSPITVTAVAAFLELSFGLSAWKEYGGSEWSLRMNPSSGNLHPTECYLLLPELDGWPACMAQTTVRSPSNSTTSKRGPREPMRSQCTPAIRPAIFAAIPGGPYRRHTDISPIRERNNHRKPAM